MGARRSEPLLIERGGRGVALGVAPARLSQRRGQPLGPPRSPECASSIEGSITDARPSREYLGQRARPGQASRPERFRWTPRAGQPLMLYPDPIGALPRGPDAAVVLYERLRLAKARKAPARCELDPLAGLQPGPARRSAPPGGARARYAEVPSRSGTLSSRAVRGRVEPAVLESSFTFQYGEVSFTLPAQFLVGMALAEAWSSIDDTLDVLWADWRGAIRTNGASWGLLHNVIGCYNLEIDPSQYLFWDEGWGAPHRLLLNALQMLIVFNEHIDDQESGDACGMGTGFRDMIKNVLLQVPAYRSEITAETGWEGTPIKEFRIHFLSIDSRFSGTWAGGQDCNRGADGKTEANSGCGIPFDSWYSEERTGRVGLYYVGMGESPDGLTQHNSYEDDRNGAPKTGCDFGANVPGSTKDRIRMQPAMLDFGGWLNDYLLFWARAALDYYYETGDVAYFTAADSLGRHVLAQILYWAGHITHEMGHVYCGSPHCCGAGLFMEHARGRLVCAVRARLGLYVDSVDLSPSPDSADACGVSGNLNNFTDDATNAGRPCCDLVNGGADCDSHAQQLCRIGNGVSPFIHAGHYDEWFFCRSRCTGATQSAWDSTNCAQIGVTSESRGVESRVVEGELRMLADTWNTCGVT